MNKLNDWIYVIWEQVYFLFLFIYKINGDIQINTKYLFTIHRPLPFRINQIPSGRNVPRQLYSVRYIVLTGLNGTLRESWFLFEGGTAVERAGSQLEPTEFDFILDHALRQCLLQQSCHMHRQRSGSFGRIRIEFQGIQTEKVVILAAVHPGNWTCWSYPSVTRRESIWSEGKWK